MNNMKKGKIVFDRNVKKIGARAFEGFSSLTSITIPKSVETIEDNAFSNCENLNNINYNGSIVDWHKIIKQTSSFNNINTDIVVCNDGEIYINPPYLTFTALENSCSIGFYNNPNASINPTIEYSFDKINWYKLSNNVSMKKNSNMYCRGLNPNGISGGYDDGSKNYFTGEGKFNISGDIMTLIDYNTLPETMAGTMMNLFGGENTDVRDNFVDIVDASHLILSAKILTPDCYANMFDSCISMVYGPKIEAETLSPYCYYKMFWNCTSLAIAPELPATNLEKECYSYMFSGCTSLTTAPELPANELVEGCYSHMFSGCTSVTGIPELPVTKLEKKCYAHMFFDCTSLTTAPELPATTLAEYCYDYMFANCTSLTTAPELPATTLTEYCYNGIFFGCTSLTTAPVLPATTLAPYCYCNMFSGCTSLTTAPELPATDLSDYCYNNMFSYCTSLIVAPELPVIALTKGCYSNMFSGCTSLTTAPELPATMLTSWCYRYMFSHCTSLTTAPDLPAATLAEGCYNGMFEDCIKLNYIKCLATDMTAYNCTFIWVNGVSNTGVFIKHQDANWSTGNSGIPSGWEVVNAEI